MVQGLRDQLDGGRLDQRAALDETQRHADAEIRMLHETIQALRQQLEER